MDIAHNKDNVTVITLSDTNAATLGEYSKRLKSGEVARPDGYIRRLTNGGMLIIQIEDDETHYKGREAGPAKEILDWPSVEQIEQALAEPQHMGD